MMQIFLGIGLDLTPSSEDNLRITINELGGVTKYHVNS